MPPSSKSGATQPKKKAAARKAPKAAEEPLPTRSTTRTRGAGNQKRTAAIEEADEPVAKRMRQSLLSPVETHPAAGKRKHPSPRKRSPLPDRAVRNVDPSGRQAKKAKAAATAAAKAQKKAEVMARTERAKHSKQQLATVEADESFDQHLAQEARVRQVSDMAEGDWIADNGDDSDFEDEPRHPNKDFAMSEEDPDRSLSASEMMEKAEKQRKV